MLVLNIPKENVSTQIVVEKGLLHSQRWVAIVHNISSRLVMITDERICMGLATPLAKQLKAAGCEVHLLTVPSGEKSKSREWKEALEERMIAADLGRDTALIALGGGVITDLAGFVAATYCRGIPFISIPTTLLGMVDASIGGKVGINTLKGKNMIGAFYHPRCILIDPHTLSTLPPQEILNGLSEMIKYALIADSRLWKQLQQHKSDQHIDEQLIRTCCLIKKEVVEKDPQEKGLRRILNFGHTIGHAIETAASYKISHGEAIALGMIAEAHLSCQLGYLKETVLEEIKMLFVSYGYPLQVPLSVTMDECLEIMRRDKKAVASQPRCVLLKGIGHVVPFEGAYCTEISAKMWEETLQWLFTYFQEDV